MFADPQFKHWASTPVVCDVVILALGAPYWGNSAAPANQDHWLPYSS